MNNENNFEDNNDFKFPTMSGIAACVAIGYSLLVLNAFLSNKVKEKIGERLERIKSNHNDNPTLENYNLIKEYEAKSPDNIFTAFEMFFLDDKRIEEMKKS